MQSKSPQRNTKPRGVVPKPAHCARPPSKSDKALSGHVTPTSEPRDARTVRFKPRKGKACHVMRKPET